jgi:hypothetical protein
MYIYQKGEGWDHFNSLAVPYFCVFPKPWGIPLIPITASQMYSLKSDVYYIDNEEI